MEMNRRNFLKISTSAIAGYFLVACTAKADPAAPATSLPSTGAATPTPGSQNNISLEGLIFNSKTWNYDSQNDVYWQIGVKYCTKPEAPEIETLGIYVPGAYLSGTANADGTYAAQINQIGKVNQFSALTAPIVFPVNTPGYSAAQPPSTYSYESISSYMKAGFVYVEAGLRGRDNGYDSNGKLTYSGGAPWGVTDLKAAVRYIRLNKDLLPGDVDHVFVFGHSGGGAQSSVMAASGDSQAYTPYLEAIGAAMTGADGQPIRDAIDGVMAWCPITSLNEADEAYEWNMGQFVSTGTRAADSWTSALSKDLATAFAVYINELGIKDKNGTILTLEKSENGIYTSGSYYDLVKATIEESLNHFLIDTTFPYTENQSGMMGAGGMPGGMPQGTSPQGAKPQGGMPQAGSQPSGTPGAGGAPGGTGDSTQNPATYQTAQEYIDSLNQNLQWVNYDAQTNTATITSLAAFATIWKLPSKNVCAFDDLERGQAENNLFGNDDHDSLHFDSVLAELLSRNQSNYATYSDWKSTCVEDYVSDLEATDRFGNRISSRVDMYNPMYYLLPYYKGYQQTTVAPHWRIRTGIKQGDTANTVELNLALALQQNSSVQDVDFATVWNQGHAMAERTGSPEDAFITWVTQVSGG